MTYDLLKAGIETRKCIITTDDYITTNVLLEPDLKPNADDKYIRNWGILPKIQLILEKGWVALIGIDEHKSIKAIDGKFTPDNVFRTGVILYLSDEHYINAFSNRPLPENRFAFVSQTTLNKINGNK